MLSRPEQHLVKFFFSYLWMSQILVGRCSAHATAFTRTILSQPESYLSKLFISAIIRKPQRLVGRYSAHATAFTRTILSRTDSQPPLYRFTLFSILDFSALRSHCSVASRHARRASAGLAFAQSMAVWHWPRFSPPHVCVYPCLLIQLFCRHCGSVIMPIVARLLPCIYHIPVYMLIFKAVIYIH